MWSSTLVDELGYVPLDKAGANLLFGFISQSYERRSLVVTTNLPFARWSEVFLDPTAAAAVIDRIVHHATVLQNDRAACKTLWGAGSILDSPVSILLSWTADCAFWGEKTAAASPEAWKDGHRRVCTGTGG